MTEVEKKIEEAAVFWCRDNQFDTHKDRGTSFKDGAHFGIQLGKDIRLEEVLEALRINYINGGKGMADFLESKFKGKV